MKDSEKKMILLLVLITIVVIVITMIVKKNNGKKEETQEQVQNSELVATQEDGTKVSISSKISETKKLDNFDVTDTSITEQNGLATIRANITNTTGATVKEFPATIKVTNKNGEVIAEIGAYIGKMKAGETRQINASINMDISEIYDFTIERK